MRPQTLQFCLKYTVRARLAQAVDYWLAYHTVFAVLTRSIAPGCGSTPSGHHRYASVFDTVYGNTTGNNSCHELPLRVHLDGIKFNALSAVLL